MESKTEFSVLKAELITHLSKEIEVLSTNMITTRLKAAFTIWIGPYILLGALVIRQQQRGVVMPLDRWTVGSLVVVSGLYLFMAYVGGRIEHYVAVKCNEWRDLITCLSLESEINIDKVRQSLRDSYLQQRVRTAYAVVWVAMFVSFGATFYMVAHLVGGGP